MTEAEDKQKEQNNQKEQNMQFARFVKRFGLTVEDSPSLQVLKDIPEKNSSEQGKPAAKHKLCKRRMNRGKGSEPEFLVSQEEAEAVITCCLCALEAIYGIQYKMPDSINLSHLLKREKLVEIENIPGLCIAYKPQKKWRKKNQKSEGKITVLRNASYISVVIDFLKICFEAEIRNKEILEKQEAQGNRVGAQSENEKQQIITWLVANCLYNMGELEYAKRYVRECQKGEKNESFDNICVEWGIPWEVWGADLKTLLSR